MKEHCDPTPNDKRKIGRVSEIAEYLNSGITLL